MSKDGIASLTLFFKMDRSTQKLTTGRIHEFDVEWEKMKKQTCDNDFPGYLERTSVLDFMGAALSCDRFNSRLKAAATGVF